MSAILRQSYIEKIERYLGKDTIIILTGQVKTFLQSGMVNTEARNSIHF